MKIDLDKYYTDEILAKSLIEKTFLLLNDITEIIEPSAGGGAFSNNIENCIAYDIEPEQENIIKQDFLALDIKYKKGRLIIGNPPFGQRNLLALKFFKKAINICDYIAFILPISQLNNNAQMYDFDLIYSIDLGEQLYTDRKLHCCFNVYRRPINGLLNNKPDYKLQDVVIKEYRRGGKYAKPTGYDIGIVNWGNVGLTPKYVGEYCQEAYFYIKNKEHHKEIIDLLSYDKINNFVKSISAKHISVSQLYKYIKDNIQGIN